MKFALILVLCFSASSVFGAAECPTNTELLKLCVPTPGPTDDAVASDLLDTLAICGSEEQLLIVVEKKGASETNEVVTVSRAGSITYMAFSGGDVDFSLSQVAGTRSPFATARFTVTFKTADYAASTTYTCK